MRLLDRLRRRLGRVPTKWSVALATGPSLHELHITEPILSPGFHPVEHLDLAADPFFIERDGAVFIFFEAIISGKTNGEIHLAYLDADGIEYCGAAIQDTVHMSFPYTFHDSDSDRYCMIPETSEAGQVRLYSAARPGGNWELDRVLLSGRPYVDTVALVRQQQWYLITEVSGGANNQRAVFTGDSLDDEFECIGEWTLDSARCRMAGRLVFSDGTDRETEARLLTQDCSSIYGRSVNSETMALSRLESEEDAGGTSAAFGQSQELLAPAPDRWFQSKIHSADLRVGPEGVFGVVDGKGRTVKHTALSSEEMRHFIEGTVATGNVDLP